MFLGQMRIGTHLNLWTEPVVKFKIKRTRPPMKTHLLSKQGQCSNVRCMWEWQKSARFLSGYDRWIWCFLLKMFLSCVIWFILPNMANFIWYRNGHNVTYEIGHLIYEMAYNISLQANRSLSFNVWCNAPLRDQQRRLLFSRRQHKLNLNWPILRLR